MGSDDLAVKWKPGTPHPDHPHVVAAKDQGKFTPEKGYDWTDADDVENFEVRPLY